MESIRVRKSKTSVGLEFTEESSHTSKLVEASAIEGVLDVEERVVGIVDNISGKQLK
jgi:hypothetical protein